MTAPKHRPRRTFTSTRSPLAYVANPTGSPRAVVAVLHPWWGLTEVMTGICDDLAELGYVAVAPDLYAGELATTAAEAVALRARKRRTPIDRRSGRMALPIVDHRLSKDTDGSVTPKRAPLAHQGSTW